VLRGREFTVVGTVPPTDRTVLTAREHEVVSGAGRGLTNGEIASELGVSEQTVKFHLGNAFRKLGVANRAQAAVAAIRLNAA
jgi:DNA-binding NarL/FixJ family response regulator